MKKFIGLATLLFALVFTAQAQNGQARPAGGRRDDGNRVERKMPTAQEMADKEIARETKMLNLTPEQVEKAKVINLKYCQQRVDAMTAAQQNKNREAMENTMKGIRMAQDNELKTILTPEQAAILDKKHGEERGERAEGRGERKGDDDKMRGGEGHGRMKDKAPKTNGQ